tara:strand:+ start:208 stop:1167 length:960 start_codon:yes stop_codon:yes gene_type:complete
MSIEKQLDDCMKYCNSLYIHGSSKSGKTTTILNYIKSHDYDYTYTTLQNIKCEEDFMKYMNSQNIYKMFFKKKSHIEKRPIKKVIIVDNIDYLQNTDKKILNIIIKIYTQNRYKYKHIMFLFIGINNSEKKIIELFNIVDKVIHMVCNENSIHDKCNNEIVKEYLKDETNINENGLGDKNIISLCYHENILQRIQENKQYYESFLNNFCKGDYYDRISFQKQLWQFNEMTFYLKVLNNQKLLKKYRISPINDLENKSIIFTKILTKFSNEYSNLNFIIHICRKLKCSKEVLFQSILEENKEICSLISKQEKKRITKLCS